MEEAIRRGLSPSAEEIAASALRSHSQIVGELLGGTCRRALDVGCGDGRFTRLLTAFCDSATGVDVKQRKIAEASEAAAAAGLNIDFRTASGEDLPFPASSFDAVIFSNSLHHIPHPELALREAARVLVPGGHIYVMEPVPAGTYQEATRLVSDETVVRTDAYRAVLAIAESKQVTSVAEIMYRARRQFADFEEWKAGQIDLDASRREAFDAAPELVRQTFENHAERENGHLVLEQISRVNLLQKTPLDA